MELTQTAEYALRAMAFLASLDKGRPARALELSRAANIPMHYVSKVMRRLVVGGLVTSQKGHGGGFVLAREPETIRFLDVLAAAGYELSPDRCAFGWGRCNAAHPCPLHPTWSELNTLFNGWADRTTLAHVQCDPRLIERVLNRGRRGDDDEGAIGCGPGRPRPPRLSERRKSEQIPSPSSTGQD